MRRMPFRILLVTLFIFAGACASSVPLNSNFWNRKGETVAVGLATLPDAHAHRVGSEMLLDLAINKAMAERLDTKMKAVAPTLLGNVSDNFVNRLTEKGFVAKKAADQIAVDNLPKFTAPGDGARYFDRDVRPLANTLGANMLLLLTVRRYGTLRNYYGFVPLGAPKALFDVRGQMIDLKTNQLLWETATNDEEATEKVEGEWSEPPDYPNLVAALQKAVPKSMDALQRRFFAASN